MRKSAEGKAEKKAAELILSVWLEGGSTILEVVNRVVDELEILRPGLTECLQIELKTGEDAHGR